MKCRVADMLIINADDWGGWNTATDAALACFAKGRITSVSAMVFMEDSERAAELAKEQRIDAGLHLNFNQKFTAAHCPAEVLKHQDRTRRFLRRGNRLWSKRFDFPASVKEAG